MVWVPQELGFSIFQKIDFQQFFVVIWTNRAEVSQNDHEKSKKNQFFEKLRKRAPVAPIPSESFLNIVLDA